MSSSMVFVNPAEYQKRAFGDTPARPDMASINAAVQARFDRIAQLQQWGEPFFLVVSLGIAAGPPAAGTQNTQFSANQDFDLLIIGAECTLRNSTINIIDSSRNHSITSGSAPIPSFANNVNSTLSTQPFDWPRPYLLPAKAQLQLVITADGTETGGTLTFRCLQPPTYQW